MQLHNFLSPHPNGYVAAVMIHALDPTASRRDLHHAPHTDRHADACHPRLPSPARRETHRASEDFPNDPPLWVLQRVAGVRCDGAGA